MVEVALLHGKLTGKSGYTNEANRMANVIWKELKTVSTPSGTGYVWNRSILSEGGKQDYLMPTTYARYIYADIAEFYLEGFHNWKDERNLTRFALPVAEWVLTNQKRDGSYWFASDIGGGVARAGIRSDSSWGRMSKYKFESSPYAQMAAWDPTGKIHDISIEVLEDVSSVDKPRAVHIPVGLFLEAMLH